MVHNHTFFVSIWVRFPRTRILAKMWHFFEKSRAFVRLNLIIFVWFFKKISQGQTKVFLGCKGHTWAETIEKSNKNYQVKSHEGSTFFKKMPHFGQNSRPGESDPYAITGMKMCIVQLHSMDYDGKWKILAASSRLTFVIFCEYCYQCLRWFWQGPAL